MIGLVVIAGVVAIAAAIYARIFFRRYLNERAEHGRAIALFSRYVPPQVVKELLARKDPRLFEAREYYATILCVRVRNFALVTEKLSPEETLRYLNEFYTIVGQAVQRHRGMIESLRGDTVNAVFGVLVEEQFQEERALRAALDIMRVMKAMESRWQTQGRKPIGVGLGINSGKIVAGDTGFQARREFAIVGNPAHVAARLEAASEDLGASIIASDTTYNVVRDLFVGVPTSAIPLRGLRGLQNAYIVRGLTRRAADEGSLTLPSQHSFKQTVVRAYETDEAASEAQSAQTVTAPTAQRLDESTGNTAPQEVTRFSRYDDDLPALPEPPPLQGTYEDDQGPPFQLPP